MFCTSCFKTWMAARCATRTPRFAPACPGTKKKKGSKPYQTINSSFGQVETCNENALDLTQLAKGWDSMKDSSQCSESSVDSVILWDVHCHLMSRNMEIDTHKIAYRLTKARRTKSTHTAVKKGSAFFEHLEFHGIVGCQDGIVGWIRMGKAMPRA